jgi:hypothetical protein
MNDRDQILYISKNTSRVSAKALSVISFSLLSHLLLYRTWHTQQERKKEKKNEKGNLRTNPLGCYIFQKG